MNIKDLNAYELIQEADLSDIKSKGYLLKHKKSGQNTISLCFK